MLNFIRKQSSIFLCLRGHNRVNWWLRSTEGKTWQANQKVFEQRGEVTINRLCVHNFAQRQKQQQRLTMEKWNFFLRLLNTLNNFLRFSKVSSFFLLNPNSFLVRYMFCINFPRSLLPHPTQCLLELQKTDKNLLSKKKNSLCYEWTTVLRRWMKHQCERRGKSENLWRFVGEKKKGNEVHSHVTREGSEGLRVEKFVNV
jgi:hypothetical protein